MKATAMSVLRVDRKLLEAAETVLGENDTVPAFVESTLRAAVARRRMRRECVACGPASADEARRTGEYVDAAEVQTQPGAMLKAACAAMATD
ncbi:prevent-host-death protein [Burkholderia sp. BCC1977]|uniref:prevent-host-death protein n=1 Tax=Burkholderia sp. BCC1977 TaxID=2817440 RepID=UPI002ABDEAC6|nr:prevent-host-death protein [Burkholderia sp. BCC1977]